MRSTPTNPEASFRKDRRRRNSTISQFAQAAEEVYTARRTTFGTPKIGSFPHQNPWDTQLDRKQLPVVESDESEEDDPSPQPTQTDEPKPGSIPRLSSWDMLLPENPPLVVKNEVSGGDEANPQSTETCQQSGPVQVVATPEHEEGPSQNLGSKDSPSSISRPETPKYGVRMSFAPPRPAESPIKSAGRQSLPSTPSLDTTVPRNQSEKWLSFKEETRNIACDLVRNHEYKRAINWLHAVREPLLECLKRDSNHPEEPFLKDTRLETNCVISKELIQIRLMMIACYFLLGDFRVGRSLQQLNACRRMAARTRYQYLVCISGLALGLFLQGNVKEALHLGKMLVKHHHRLLEVQKTSDFECWEAEKFVTRCYLALGDVKASEDIKKNWTYEPKYVEPTSVVEWARRQQRFLNEAFDGHPPEFKLPGVDDRHEEPSFWKSNSKHTEADGSPSVTHPQEGSSKGTAPPLPDDEDLPSFSSNRTSRWSLKSLLSSKSKRDSGASCTSYPSLCTDDYEFPPWSLGEIEEEDPNIWTHLKRKPDIHEIVLHELSRCDCACRKEGALPPVEDAPMSQKPSDNKDSNISVDFTNHRSASFRKVARRAGTEPSNSCSSACQPSKQEERNKLVTGLGIVIQTPEPLLSEKGSDCKRVSTDSVNNSGYYSSSSERDSGYWPHPVQPGLHLREGEMF